MRSLCVIVFLLCVGTCVSGCHYLQNRRDDFLDIFILGAGGAVAGETPMPPAFGVYVEGTEFLHFGGMYFAGYMADLDRRGAAITKVEEDCRLGLGPVHRWRIDESYDPANIYKSGAMHSWEERMAANSIKVPELAPNLREPPETVPAKRLRFHETDVGPFPRGFQDWGFIGVDLALSEPFLIHAGMRVRAGIDISQISDFFLGIFGLDMYGDDASAAEYQGLYDFTPPDR